MVKNIFTAVLILFFTAEVSAQAWLESSYSKPKFSGFSESESFSDSEANDDFGGLPDNPAVPIIESIVGLLGLGGVYAWRLIARKRNKD